MSFADPGPWTAREGRVEARFLTNPAEIEPGRWREVAALASDSSPFLDDVWTDTWIRSYQPAEPILLGRWVDERLVGLAPMQRLTETWTGWSVSVLQSLTNLESPRFEFLSSGGEAVVEQLWRGLCADKRWDVIRIEALPKESATLRAALKVADELGWHRVVADHHPSPWKPLPAKVDGWEEGLSRKFRSNLRNREKRLQAMGEVTFEVANHSAPADGALEAFYALEASSWKAGIGTAIAQRPPVRAFYDCLVQRSGDRIWLPVLRVGNRPIAAQIICLAGRTLFMLKTAYHPDFAPFAPGQLLTSRLIQYAIAHGMQTLDFLGDPMTWKADWAPQLRPHCKLVLFAPTGVGRYAYWTRFGVQEHIKQVPGVLRLVRRVRAGAAALHRRATDDPRLPDRR